MHVGPYEILGELGRGGMGVVYRAWHKELNREVALKLMRERSASDEDTERFVREVRLAAQAGGHPGIARVHHAGCIPDGRLYYVMELVEGRSLHDIIREGPLPAPRAVRYVGLAAEAVHHAHTQGVVHRDLSPKNILIDAQDRPRILDFGLSKPLSDATRLTATGTVLGTPLYMAPEQAEGRAAITALTDVYTLGAVLYACLAGRPPFEEGPVYRVLQQVTTEEPPPIESVAAVPGALAGIVRRAMQKRPIARYPSALALAEDLHAFARGDRVSRAPTGGIREAVAGKRRLLLPVAIAAAGVLAAAVTVLAFLGGPDPAPPVSPRTAGGTPHPPRPALPAADDEARRLVHGAIRTLANPDAVGAAISFRFRALHPDRADGGPPPDPRNPFVLGAAAEREALRARFASPLPRPVGIPEAPATEPLERAIADLDRALDRDPAAFPAWAAGLLACRLDGRVVERLVARRSDPAAALLEARFRLLSGQPEEAIAALGDLAGDEARLLRGLARILLPDPEAAALELRAISDPALIVEALPLRAIAAIPELGGREAHVRDALHLMEGRAGPDEPPGIIPFHGRLLVLAGRFQEGLLLLRDAAARYPDDAEILGAYVASLDLACRLAADPALFFGPRGQASEAAAGALRALGVGPADLLAAAGRLGGEESLRPSGLAALARWAPDLSRARRTHLEEMARGLDACDPGLAGALLRRALRLLVPAEDPTRFVLSADRLARMAFLLEPSAVGPLLSTALGGDVSPLMGPRTLPGWIPPSHPPDIWLLARGFEEVWLRAGLDPCLALVFAALPDVQGDEADAERRARWLGRARRLVEEAREVLAPRETPETDLLAAEIRLGLGDTAGAGEAALRAVEERGHLPLRPGGAQPFLERAARVLDRSGRPDDAMRARAGWSPVGSADVQELVDLWQELANRSDQRPLAPLCDRVLAQEPYLVFTYVPARAAYAATGRFEDYVAICGRSMRLGFWPMDDVLALGGLTHVDLRDVASRPPVETVDEALGAAVARIADPDATSPQIVRGLGIASSLLALGVARGPLLGLVAYGRLRLGDLWAAREDARAAAGAPITPFADPNDRYRLPRIPMLVRAAVARSLGDEGESRALLRDLDPEWLTTQSMSPSTPIVGPMILEYLDWLQGRGGGGR